MAVVDLDKLPDSAGSAMVVVVPNDQVLREWALDSVDSIVNGGHMLLMLARRILPGHT